MTEQEKQPVIQSNPLVNAQYKLDLIEQKVLRFVISMIRPDDEKLEKRYYRIEVKDLEEYLGWEKGGEIFDYIKKVADKLKSTTIKVIKPTTTIVTSWIASYEYPKNKGWIEFEISSKLESELLKLKDQFTQYYLKNISKLKSQYSIRLYELMKQYLPLGKREIEIEDLKVMLGIGKDEYQKFNNLKRIIIEKAVKDIITKTDIEFKIKYIKEARKVVAILFYDIQQKTYIPPSIMSLIPEKYRENKQILSIVRKFIELMGEKYVNEKLNYTNSRNPQNWIDYFYKTCEQNWGEGYVPGQQPLTGVFEELEDGTTIEINGVRHIINGGSIITEKGAIPQGHLYKMINNGSARIIDKH